MKIFPVAQIADIDQYTIENEPIKSIDLMERASKAFIVKFDAIYLNDPFDLIQIDVFVGPGNNGGDALAIARLLEPFVEEVNVWITVPESKLSKDSRLNYERLKKRRSIHVKHVMLTEEIKKPSVNSIVIDGLFGSGLNRPLQGWSKEVVRYINSLPNEVVSIDMPSGLMGEDNSGNDPEAIVKANHTITFQMPKLAFLFPENESFVGCWHVVNIGLHAGYMQNTQTDFYYTKKQDVIGLLKKRKQFSHKGHFGHALLISGSYGKMGAAVLASRACLKAGVGLLTTHVPRLGYNIIQTAVPEAMASIDRSDILISEHPMLNDFNAIGIGPGLGVKPNTITALYELMQEADGKPMVLDADALNILSKDEKCYKALPSSAIITPHPGEFDRLLGTSDNAFQRLQKAITFAREKHVVVVLKGAFTAVINYDGSCHFNSTGNAGMATAGSGDVLTGIILSFLAQGYAPIEAAKMAVFIHGAAADEFVDAGSMESLTAGDIVDYLNMAFRQIQS